MLAHVTDCRGGIDTQVSRDKEGELLVGSGQLSESYRVSQSFLRNIHVTQSKAGKPKQNTPKIFVPWKRHGHLKVWMRMRCQCETIYTMHTYWLFLQRSLWAKIPVWATLGPGRPTFSTASVFFIFRSSSRDGKRCQKRSSFGLFRPSEGTDASGPSNTTTKNKSARNEENMIVFWLCPLHEGAQVK